MPRAPVLAAVLATGSLGLHAAQNTATPAPLIVEAASVKPDREPGSDSYTQRQPAWDFELTYAPDPPRGPLPPGVDAPPVDVVVVDRVDRPVAG